MRRAHEVVIPERAIRVLVDYPCMEDCAPPDEEPEADDCWVLLEFVFELRTGGGGFTRAKLARGVSAIYKHAIYAQAPETPDDVERAQRRLRDMLHLLETGEHAEERAAEPAAEPAASVRAAPSAGGFLVRGHALGDLELLGLTYDPGEALWRLHVDS
jgi:hypothetical protein